MSEENPDILENGHVDIAHPLVKKFASYRISGEEWQVLWVIMAKTWAWHKSSDKIALKTFYRSTNIKKPRIIRLLQKLIEKNIITKKGNKNPYKWHINSHSKTWKSLPKKVTTKKNVTNKGNGVTNKGNGVTNKGKIKSPEHKSRKAQGIPKETTSKETTSKETLYTNTQSEPSVEKQLTPEQIKEGDQLMGIYYRAHRGYLTRLTKEFQTRRKIRMRQLIDGTMLEGISSKLIEAAIKESSSGVPWDILTESWIIKQINRKKLKEGTKGTWY